MQPSFEVRMTPRFRDWYAALRDREGKRRIGARLERFRAGNPGLRRVLGEGVWELKIVSGPGYRVYYRLEGMTAVLLLCGGDKGSQRHDIALAMHLARELEQTDHGS